MWTVKNTFVMMKEESHDGPRRKGPCRYSSLPPSFKLSVPADCLADASSDASTDVPDPSSLEESPVKHNRPRRYTSAAVLGTSDDSFARQAAIQLAASSGHMTPRAAAPCDFDSPVTDDHSASPEDDGESSSDGLRTPSTMSPDSSPTRRSRRVSLVSSPTGRSRRVSFAIDADAVSPDDSVSQPSSPVQAAVCPQEAQDDVQPVAHGASRERALTCSQESQPHPGGAYWRTYVAPAAQPRWQAPATPPPTSLAAPPGTPRPPAPITLTPGRNASGPPGMWSSSMAMPNNEPVPSRQPSKSEMPSNACAAPRQCASARRWAPTPEEEPVDSVRDVIERFRVSLASSSSIVVCAEAIHGPRGWSVTAYVQPDALKVYKGQLFEHAQQSLLAIAEQSGNVFVLGYAATPFSPMPLGFGAALTEMQHGDISCVSSYAHGFCDSPGTCHKAHPKCRVGIHVMLKPARAFPTRR